MAKHGKKADELTAPAGLIIREDDDNTPQRPRETAEPPGAQSVGDTGGINLIKRTDDHGKDAPPPEKQSAPKEDATPADLYAEAVALHGKGSEEAAKLRIEHQGDAGFQAVADWIDRVGAGVLRAGTAKPAEAGGSKRYRVQLQDCPAHEVTADSPHEAVDRYKQWAGIISTPHRFDVTEL